MSTLSEVQAFLAFLREVFMFVDEEHYSPRTVSRAITEVGNASHAVVPAYHPAMPALIAASMVASPV